MKFRATIHLSGKTATGVQVPKEVVEGLDGGKRPAVRVKLNGYAYRSTVAPMGGLFMLPISAEHREGAGVAVGDEVDVELELDTEPRVLPIPLDFQMALDADLDAKRFFDGLSYSKKEEYPPASRSANRRVGTRAASGSPTSAPRRSGPAIWRARAKSSPASRALPWAWAPCLMGAC